MYSNISTLMIERKTQRERERYEKKIVNCSINSGIEIERNKNAKHFGNDILMHPIKQRRKKNNIAAINKI